MTCALFSGSFNPIHYGHLSIAGYVARKSEIDQVRLILSPRNPIKDLKQLSDPKERLKSVREAISKSFSGDESTLGKIVVSDIEFHLPEPLYTYNTLRHLKENEPETHFIFIMGADNIAIIEKWYRWEDILKETEIWVYPRKGTDGEKLCAHYSSLPGVIPIRFLSDAPLFDISSTEIREGIKKA